MDLPHCALGYTTCDISIITMIDKPQLRCNMAKKGTIFRFYRKRPPFSCQLDDSATGDWGVLSKRQMKNNSTHHFHGHSGMCA